MELAWANESQPFPKIRKRRKGGVETLTTKDQVET